MLGAKSKVIALLLSLLLWFGTGLSAWIHGNNHGHRVERTTWQAKLEQARADAAEQARTIEQQRYGGLLDALNEQYRAQRDIAERLADDINRLRERPDRRPEPLPGDPSTDCAGATGAELSGPDARFLARLAARADRHRAALAACYDYADALQQ